MKYVIKIVFAMMLLCPNLIFADNPVPANLPKPDKHPVSNKQPVKVYIQSGQSNSLGFGAIDGGTPTYSSIFLSADPRIMPHNMQISDRIADSAMLPFRVFKQATGDTEGGTAYLYRGDFTDKPLPAKAEKEMSFPLGKVDEPLPRLDGPTTVEIKAFIEVPKAGMHRVFPGTGDSSLATVFIDQNQVYRKVKGDKKPDITPIELKPAKRYPIRIVYHQTGDAAFWMQLMDLQARGTLKALTEEGKYQTFVDENGAWTVREDVILNNAYMGKGKSVELSPKNLGRFGPELGFGYVMGTFHDEPVIILKADIGNRSLAWDCLPPGSERYEVEVTDRKTGEKTTMIYAGYGDTQSRWPKEQGEPKPGGWYAGKQYDDYTAALQREIKALPEKYPQWADQGFEIAGFIWWQGHKDQNPVHAANYEKNLVNLIKAWRKEFNAPDAKFVVATIAFDGWNLDGPGKTVAEAQLAVSGETGNYPEFEGNVKTIEARNFWRNIGESPKNQGYHYNHNAETYFLVGDAMGRAMVELEGGDVEPRPLKKRPEPRSEWPENPTLEEAVQMIYTDEFISPWIKSDAEPTQEQLNEMAVIYKPIIMDLLLPQYTKDTVGVPAYRRGGISINNILLGEAPTKRTSLVSQLDQIIELYNAAGIDQYNWKPFGPDMMDAEWWYYSFDPEEPANEKTKEQFRDVEMPKGMENWYAIDFDPKKAGWKKGPGPFGQVDGEKKPLRNNSRSICRSHIMPGTLWENDALFIRQTFKLPPLNTENKRYRLVVGGGSFPWGGEGYEVYVNGKLFARQTQAFFKGGGTRGSIIYNDFLPEFKSGEVTIAVKSFLRRAGHKGKSAPPQGHISVWLEEAELPEPVMELKEELMAAKTSNP